MARTRSPNYPAVGLPEAISRAMKVYQIEGTHKAAPEVVAKAIGYMGLNGASLGMLSALKKYGLLEESGGDLKLSTLAINILADTKDSPERQQAIREAAFLPALFTELQKHYGNSLPSDENLRTYLLKRGFNLKAVDVPIRAYRDTVRLVTEEGGEYTPPGEEIEQEKMLEGLESFEPEVSIQPRTIMRPASYGRASSATIEVGSYPVSKSCSIRLIASAPYTRSSIEALIKQLQLNLELDVFPHDPPPGADLV